jgi:hypothetical protein
LLHLLFCPAAFARFKLLSSAAAVTAATAAAAAAAAAAMPRIVGNLKFHVIASYTLLFALSFSSRQQQSCTAGCKDAVKLRWST